MRNKSGIGSTGPAYEEDTTYKIVGKISSDHKVDFYPIPRNCFYFLQKQIIDVNQLVNFNPMIFLGVVKSGRKRINQLHFCFP